MEKDSNNKMANDFIELWQENFAKTMQDQEIMLQLNKAMGFMQQFYGQNNQSQPASSAFAAPFAFGADEPDRQQLLRRISELEARVAELEAGRSAKRSQKKTT